MSSNQRDEDYNACHCAKGTVVCFALYVVVMLLLMIPETCISDFVFSWSCRSRGISFQAQEQKE